MKSKYINTRAHWIFTSLLLLSSNYAMSACLNATPTLQQEFKQSKIVAIGVVESSEDFADVDDPNGIAGTLYRFKPIRYFKGRGKKQLNIYAENTSSRFPMNIGMQYLVFLQPDGKDFYVDSCGNSGELAERKKEVSELSK